MLAGGTKTQLIALKLQSLSKPDPEPTDPLTPPKAPISANSEVGGENLYLRDGCEAGSWITKIGRGLRPRPIEHPAAGSAIHADAHCILAFEPTRA
jgi:hypothetical protein